MNNTMNTKKWLFIGVATISFLFTMREICLAYNNLWTSAAELADKPTSGTAWNAVLSYADQNFYPPDVSNQDSDDNVKCLAAAIVYARTGQQSYKDRVVDACEYLASNGNPGQHTLAWARETGAYALAADLVGYRTSAFETWLHNMAEVYIGTDGRTTLTMYYIRPNNWGAMALGSLSAIYAYLGNNTRLNEIRDYFVQGLEGPDPGYTYGDLSWQCDGNDPHLINPPCTDCGIDKNGLIPDDQRRAGSFHCAEPTYDAHIGGWIEGAICGARILDRIGMSIYDAGSSFGCTEHSGINTDPAFKRMIVAHEETYPEIKMRDPKEWVLPILDEVYGLNFSNDGERGVNAAKIAGFGSYIVGGGTPPDQYNLTINISGNGSVDLNPSGGSYDDGTVVTLTANPDAGNQFDNWTGDLTGTVNPETITMNSNKTVTANFSVIPPTQYTLTVNTSGNGSVSLNPSGGTYDDGTVVTLTATPDSTNQFDGWSGDLSGTANPETITMNANKTVTASFSPVGEGTPVLLTVSSVTASMDDGNVPANTIDNNLGTRWSADGDPQWIQYDLGQSYTVCYVAFAAYKGDERVYTFDVEVSADGVNFNQLIAGAQNSGTTLQQEDIDFPDGNGRYVRLIGHSNSHNTWNSYTEVDIYGYSGSPPTQYTLTVNTSGNGSVSLNPSGGTYDDGTVVTLTATPDAGNQFDNWTGDLTGTVNPESITIGDLTGTVNPESITMNSNKTVTANFSVIPPTQYTLTVNTSGNGSVSLNPSGGTYDDGTVVTLTATPDAGNQFDNWTGDLI
jgi:uncharacterized repeat protein (TIGR02543 family)